MCLGASNISGLKPVMQIRGFICKTPDNGGAAYLAVTPPICCFTLSKPPVSTVLNTTGQSL